MMNLDLLIPKDAPKGGSWAWAKIDTGFDSGGNYSVNIRLDGEDADLEATPVFLCDPEEFHSTNAGTNPRSGRTLVQLLDGQVYVYGQSGGMPRAGQTDIAAGRYANSKNGRALWVPDNPSIRVADGGGGWFRFSPTEGGTTAWRNTLTAWPGGPALGMTFWNIDTSKLEAWNGSTWVVIGPYTPPGDTGWIDVPLRAGYVGMGETPRYRRIGNAVYLRGRVALTGGGNFAANGQVVVGDVPAGFRPNPLHMFAIVGANGTTSGGRFWIDTSGQINMQPQNATGNMSIACTYLND